MEDQKGVLEDRIDKFFERRNAINAKIEAAAGNAHISRQKKEALVAEIKKKKQERSRFATEARALASKLRSRHEEAEKIAATAPSRKLKKELETLEWAFQTHTGSYAEELRMWGEMGRLDSMLKRSMERDGILKEAKTLLPQLQALRKAHDERHKAILSLSKEWELQDADIQKSLLQMSELRKERAQIEDGIQAAKTELDALYSKERSERSEARKERNKVEQKTAEEENILLQQKAQEVLEKLKSRKKLTGDDLFIMQRANLY